MAFAIAVGYQKSVSVLWPACIRICLSSETPSELKAIKKFYIGRINNGTNRNRTREHTHTPNRLSKCMRLTHTDTTINAMHVPAAAAHIVHTRVAKNERPQPIRYWALFSSPEMQLFSAVDFIYNKTDRRILIHNIALHFPLIDCCLGLSSFRERGLHSGPCITVRAGST